MNLDHMLAQLRGTRPSDILQPDSLAEDWTTCVQRRCRRPAAIKKNGQPAKSCQKCLDRRSASCRRRRAALGAEGGCSRCAYRKRLESDFLCQRCRDDRDIERAQKRRRPRCRCDRRVRGQARQGASRQQPRPGRLALERGAPEAGTLVSLPVAAARPGTARRARMGEALVRNGLAFLPLLAVPSRSRRAIHGSRVSASPDAL